jgi:hypothetical protein
MTRATRALAIAVALFATMTAFAASKEEASPWAKAITEGAKEAGVFVGDCGPAAPNNTYRWREACTREEVATATGRTFEAAAGYADRKVADLRGELEAKGVLPAAPPAGGPATDAGPAAPPAGPAAGGSTAPPAGAGPAAPPAAPPVGTPVAPTITTQPASQTAADGSDVTFPVVATGDPLTYQWRFNGVAIADATDAALTMTDVSSEEAGNYSVVVTNATGSVTSSDAVLTVTPAWGPAAGGATTGGTPPPTQQGMLGGWTPLGVVLAAIVLLVVGLIAKKTGLLDSLQAQPDNTRGLGG